jgi:hypothetical protein
MTRYIVPIAMILILAILLVLGVFNLYNGLHTNTVTVKVTDLQTQQIVIGYPKHMKTRIRYLVITDFETFVCENSYLKFKFNNSDIFYHLKKDSTYTMQVQGIGKTLLSDYRNILKINK